MTIGAASRHHHHTSAQGQKPRLRKVRFGARRTDHRTPSEKSQLGQEDHEGVPAPNGRWCRWRGARSCSVRRQRGRHNRRAFAGAASAEANAYFGAVGTQTTTASGVGSIATHGAIAGTRQAAEGGNFWTGFEAGLIATAVSTYGPQEMGYTGNVVKSSLIGGTTSAINGEKFANGAILGAFSADFRTWVEGRSSLVGKMGPPEYGVGSGRWAS
ncbi:hypothetical protein SAMN05444171_6504 [Bradyrhizobium lablabi]|uniref:Uncharacterized protein n=2 Tax=Bradyrhizobium TaxID=374 RepID=A0ABY0P936_9BRAD|nr:hypothetical protein SAMN05444163_0664 [Bradyrhizobium ottawaense]SEE17033.1 hypothetical protein SAMN05444171_6504 [Bradyrhizobium lablabi]SHM13138.1 hypothetical protein SAMN05444321_5306 [Bradyrhizobium lablabi]